MQFLNKFANINSKISTSSLIGILFECHISLTIIYTIFLLYILIANFVVPTQLYTY